MKHETVRVRQRVNLLLDSEMVAEARSLGINLSQAVNQALTVEIKLERDRRWANENQGWIAAYNEWYDEHGDPLAHLEPL